MGHGAKQLLLGVDVEIFEDVRRERVGQNAENDDLFILRHVEDHLGDVGRRPFPKDLAERAEIARINQTLEFLVGGFSRP